MPVYTYKAYNANGQVKTGIADADTARDARIKLRRDGLHVTDIAQMESVTQKRQSRFARSRLRRLTKRELPQVTRQLATLLRSGIPLNEGLQAMVEQIDTRSLEAVFRDVRERINQGSSFAEAIEQHPGVFSRLYISMAQAGEAAGNLDVVLDRLANFMLKQAKMTNRVTSALMYPMIMVFVGAVVLVILMTKVVPDLIQLVEQKGSELPGPTRLLKSMSDFIGEYWYLLLLAVVLANMAWGAIRRTPKGRLTTDLWKLKLPVFGDLYVKQDISRFAVTLATLLRTGVPILEGLKIVRDIIRLAPVEIVVDDLHKAIMEGADISAPLKRSKIFPPMVGYMIAIGEQSGELEDALDRLSESYEDEVELATDRMTALLEPLLILVMAAMVGFIVISIVLPMMELGNI
ncbi:MAG: type II secretion system F family protein [Planctomycetota bacterium]|nr:type II secretion system F family protein [Planctomycetota bacterium]